MRHAVILTFLALAFTLSALADGPPALQESGTVREWGGPHQFSTPPGEYVLEADPILPQGSRMGGLPGGDIGRPLRVDLGRVTPAQVYYDPTNGPPEFANDAPPGYAYIVITNLETREGLRFNSREEAIYYMGITAITFYEEISRAGHFPKDAYQTVYYCSVADCLSIQEARAQEAAEAWQELVQAVEDFVQAVVDWVVSVVQSIVDWFLSLFGG